MAQPEPALILKTAPTGESFVTLSALSAERGLFYCLQRYSKSAQKNGTRADLFDTAELQLQAARNGNGTLFINDYRLQQKREKIGHSYPCLLHASNYAALLVRNATHMPDTAALFDLAERTLDAFDSEKAPQIVFLKGLYLLLLTEGFPVREDWLPRLDPKQFPIAQELIQKPSPPKPTTNQIEACDHITEHLCNWLRRETDIVLPWKA
ncbi:MAG: hypothetical protein ACON39_03670 [Coraliomargaritaceae bacterium]